jgi:hypothetical protein
MAADRHPAVSRSCRRLDGDTDPYRVRRREWNFFIDLGSDERPCGIPTVVAGM